MIKRGLQRWFNSLDTKTDGLSGRKLTAFWFSLLTAGVVISYARNGIIRGEFYHITSVLSILCGTILLCLGIVTFGQIIRFRNGEKGDTKKGVEDVNNGVPADK